MKKTISFLFSLQEGAKSISVWKLETRTTCAVEAINGVLGRGIPGNSNFFNFVFFIQKFELARSIKLRNLATRCVVKRKRNGKNERSVLIRNASELLEKGELNVDEFLNRPNVHRSNHMDINMFSSMSPMKKTTYQVNPHPVNRRPSVHI